MSIIIKFGNRVLRFIDCHIVPFVGWLCNAKNKYVNVIYYHDIVVGEGFSYMRTEKDVFIRHMNYLADNGYETLRFDDLDSDSKQTFEKKRVVIAFDDGWRSNYTEIFDFMKLKNLKYNVFLTIGEIGNNPEYLTWDMVREMHESGLVGFGAHTYTHPNMAVISAIDYHHEVNDADEKFEQELGYRPVDFCYPFGYYSEESNLCLENQSNYQRIYTSKKLYSYQQNGRVVFGRNGISNDDPMRYFIKKVKGYANWHKLYHDHFIKHLLDFYHLFKHTK